MFSSSGIRPSGRLELAQHLLERPLAGPVNRLGGGAPNRVLTGAVLSPVIGGTHEG